MVVLGGGSFSYERGAPVAFEFSSSPDDKTFRAVLYAWEDLLSATRGYEGEKNEKDF